MLGIDQATQLRWQREERRETAQERRQRELAEELQNHAVTVEPDAGYDITNFLAQIGTPMRAQDMIDKLKKCNSRLYFERALADPDLFGVYLLDYEQAPGGLKVTKRHLFGMGAGLMPEFSVIHKTRTKVANQELFGRKEAIREVPWKYVDTFASETRGWRTVLVRLLRAQLITEYDVEKYFGWTPSRDSKRWHDQTR